MAKCPKCDVVIANIHYEAHRPDSLSGYRGSQSFTAVAYPCGHAIGAVPTTWELRLEEIDKTNKELNKKIDYLHREVLQLSALVNKIILRR